MFKDYDAEAKINQNRRINKKRPYRVSFMAAKYPVALLLTQHTWSQSITILFSVLTSSTILISNMLISIILGVCPRTGLRLAA